MDVYEITEAGPRSRTVDELPQLLADPGQLVWVDVHSCDAAAVATLRRVFGFHELALHDSAERNHVAKLHVYADHAFVVLHAPKIGDRGHVHYVELDQFIGRNYLVTVHGPYSSKVSAEVAAQDTDAVLHRMQSGHLHPQTQLELSSAIVASLIRREIEMVAHLAERSGLLERRLTTGEIDQLSNQANSRGNLETYLDDLFTAWYELLAIRTIATHSATTYDRMAHTIAELTDADRTYLADIADRFEQVVAMADGQREFLHGVIEFFQTKISTHMALTADADAKTAAQQNDDMRKISAWIGIIAVPTAVTGFFGQNIPYPGFGDRAGFVVSTALMVVIALALYLVFKRKHWL